MRMPWEDDINWGNIANTIMKAEPMIDNYVIAELLKNYEALERRLSVAEKHIKILEIDHQIDVINPSWWDEDEKGAEADEHNT